MKSRYSQSNARVLVLSLARALLLKRFLSRAEAYPLEKTQLCAFLERHLCATLLYLKNSSNLEFAHLYCRSELSPVV